MLSALHSSTWYFLYIPLKPFLRLVWQPLELRMLSWTPKSVAEIFGMFLLLLRTSVMEPCQPPFPPCYSYWPLQIYPVIMCYTHSRCSRSEGLPHAAMQPKNLASSWSELARTVEARLQKPVSFGVLERLVRCQIYFMIQKFKQVWGILCVGYRSSHFLQVIIMLTCHRG